MKERFCWNCKFEKDCQIDSVITDEDCSICSRHKFIGERKKKQKSPTRKKNLTKQTKLAIIWNNIKRGIKKIKYGV